MSTTTSAGCAPPSGIADDPLIVEADLLAQIPGMTTRRWRDWRRVGNAPQPDVTSGHSRWYRTSSVEAWLAEHGQLGKQSPAVEGVQR